MANIRNTGAEIQPLPVSIWLCSLLFTSSHEKSVNTASLRQQDRLKSVPVALIR